RIPRGGRRARRPRNARRAAARAARPGRRRGGPLQARRPALSQRRGELSRRAGRAALAVLGAAGGGAGAAGAVAEPGSAVQGARWWLGSRGDAAWTDSQAVACAATSASWRRGAHTGSAFVTVSTAASIMGRSFTLPRCSL